MVERAPPWEQAQIPLAYCHVLRAVQEPFHLVQERGNLSARGTVQLRHSHLLGSLSSLKHGLQMWSSERLVAQRQHWESGMEDSVQLMECGMETVSWVRKLHLGLEDVMAWLHWLLYLSCFQVHDNA